MRFRVSGCWAIYLTSSLPTSPAVFLEDTQVLTVRFTQSRAISGIPNEHLPRRGSSGFTVVTNPVMLDLDVHLHSTIEADSAALNLCYTLHTEWAGVTCAPLSSLAHPPVFKNLTQGKVHTFSAWITHNGERSASSTLHFEVAPLQFLEAAPSTPSSTSARPYHSVVPYDGACAALRAEAESDRALFNAR